MMNVTRGLTILTNDPSLTAWGWVVLVCNKKEVNIIDCGCIRTGAENKKRRIRKGDDTVRRISEINHELLRIMTKYGVEFLLSELPHGSQNASSAVMIGVVTGIIQTIADIKNIPIEWYSEQDAKKSVLGRKSVSKEEMIQTIDKLYHVDWKGVKYADEAIADAMAIFHCARFQSPTIKMFLN